MKLRIPKRQPTKDKKPLMLVLGGLSGSGKTSVGLALVKELTGAVLIDADIIRKTMHGVHPETSLPDAAYSTEQTERFIKTIHGIAQYHLKLYDTVIVTGTFLNKHHREAQERIASNAHADFIGFWLQAPAKTLFHRVTRRTGTPSDANTKVLKRQQQNVQEPDLHEKSWHVIKSNRKTEIVAADIQAALSQSPRRAYAKNSRPGANKHATNKKAVRNDR